MKVKIVKSNQIRFVYLITNLDEYCRALTKRVEKKEHK